ncbi:MAG TPA: PhoU domain-containing protein [Prolixibacteraceae bacterium]|nr:PhoU domain-containing protein [Prolixibacteraceae bacterium]
MPQRKHEAIADILSDYEKLANRVLHQLDEVGRLISATGQLPGKEQLKALKENEKKINRTEVKISEKIVHAIALYQPVASEIRNLIACYRIVISLERMGDLSISIAKQLSRINNQEVYSSLSGHISKMMDLSIEMARNSMLSFINHDTELALGAIQSESVVDDFNHRMLNKVAERADLVAGDKNIMVSFINIKEMVSHIERISDHAANIAEASIYAHEGKDIRHHRVTRPTDKPTPEDHE